MNIHEVLEYGPICASDEELDILITVNGSYLNLWVGGHSGTYEGTDGRSTGSQDPDWNGLYGITGADMIDRAEQYLDDIRNELDEE